MEQIWRRDILNSQDIAAVKDSAGFVQEHMSNASVFWHPHDTLRFALSLIKGSGLALEFGVATGTTLKIIADAVAGDRTVVGFDSFTGLPEPWRTGFPVGEFAQAEIPVVEGAEVIVGLFTDELPGFLARNEEQVAFLHVDCDLYSSSKTVLDLVGDVSRPTRCWYSTSSSTSRAGGSTSFGRGPNSSHVPAARSNTLASRETTSRWSCGCTDQLSNSRAQLSRLVM